MRQALALILLTFAATLAAADLIVEESSGVEFPANITLSGQQGEVDLRATGTGLRKKFVFKVYAACFYMDPSVELGDDPYGTAIDGSFAKRIVMRFLRDVDADKIQNAYREGIRKTLPEGFDDEIDAFCGLFRDKVLKGETIVLTDLPGLGLTASQAKKELGGIDSPQVIAAIWATWFGKDPVSGDLKKGLLGL